MSGVRILYAEDDPDVQKITALALRMLGGYEVKACNDGVEVLEEVKGFDPDLILLDVMMPRMDGVTALQKMRSDPSAKVVPVIFFTAKVMPSECARYKELGALGVIAKPYDPTTVCATIKSLTAGGS